VNNFLIPANTKKSRLILGFFTPIDLAIFGIGCTITLIMLMIFPNMDFRMALIIVTPALISGFLVLPVPYYHNVLQLLTNIILYFINRKRYYWKGWCIHNGEEK